MIHSGNILIISTTLPNHKIAEKRRNHLVNNFSQYNIPILFNHGIQDSGLKNHDIMYRILLNALETFQKLDIEYGLICDDDFVPIPNFLEVLNQTITLLPPKWECLHLCPGFLWGRQFRAVTKIGQLHPEGAIDTLDYHPSGRFFQNCTPDLFIEKKIWLGGPIAFVIKRHQIATFINTFKSFYGQLKQNSDVMLTHMLHKNHFICRMPLLGYEEEQGGTTFRE